MIEKHIKIGDKILKKLQSEEGIGKSINILNELKREQDNEFDIRHTFIILIEDYQLIKRYKDNSIDLITLTRKGKIASEIGLLQYFNNLDEKKRLDIKSKQQNISYVKIYKWLTIAALIISIITIVLHYLPAGARL